MSLLQRVGSGLSFVLLALLAACAVGPDYQRPEATAVPEAYAGAPAQWKEAEPSAHLAKGPWWELFGDPDLNGLETDAASANQDLKAAAARYEQARASADVARSGLFPHLALALSATRQRDSENRPVGGKPGQTYNGYSAPFDAGYEVDLWGRVRRLVESARAQAEASAADVESVRLAVTAEVAADYFTLRALDAQQDLLRSTVEAYRRSLDLTRNRRAEGLVTDLDVAQAQTQLSAAEAQLPALKLQRVEFEHALAVLTGRNPSLFHLDPRPLDAAPPSVPPALPSDLLQRRPDIAAAERRMAAANASIGVAKGAFFPSLQLGGQAGYQSGAGATLFNWPSRFWALGASVAAPLFQGGRLKGNLRAAKAGHDESVARYRQTVLAAFQQVEDDLSAQTLLAEEEAKQEAALEAARRSLTIAQNRYEAGLVTYLQVATAQAAALDRERVVILLRGQRFVTAVALVKALGGGWQETEAPYIWHTPIPRFKQNGARKSL